MLDVAFQRVPADKVERIRAWMAECARREAEVQQTFAQEGMRAEKAWLVHTSDGAIFVYAMDVENAEASRGCACLDAADRHRAPGGEARDRRWAA